MTLKERLELEKLGRAFRQQACSLRALGELYDTRGCNKVQAAANLGAGYADRAAELVEERIACDDIARIALGDELCATQ
jgi:hypothetical protein